MLAIEYDVMLQFEGITKRYKKAGIIYPALEEVSIRIDKGEFVTVTGPSGSGKSTLLNIAGGLINPDFGNVYFHEQNIYLFNNSEFDDYRKRHVGYVFQQFHLIPYLTVFENIRMVCSGLTVAQQIDSYLEKCSLQPLRNKYPSELSVGEKQRTAFIRAIINHPDLLLADEPTGNLDPLNSRILMSLTKEFNQSGGTVILVSHDQDSKQFASRHITLDSGRLISDQKIT